MSRKLWFVLLVSCPALAVISPPPAEVEFVARPYLVPHYQQLVVAEFSSEAAAAKAVFEIEPLYEGYRQAVSCRWDDNIDSDLPAKQILDQRGVKATWYLNSNFEPQVYGAYDFRDTARVLLENGHSIGGHSLSHPYMTYVNRNRMFQEIAGIRIEWESELDTLLHSYALSYTDCRNEFEGDQVQAQIIECMLRAGVYHISVFKNFDDAVPSDLVISPIMPPENQTLADFKKAVVWALTDQDVLQRMPCITHSMHAWYGTPSVSYGFDELERRVDYLNQFADSWQCNQNQYAAYRRQSRESQLGNKQINGSTVSIVLERPMINDLNDAVPLTVAVSGIRPSELEKLTVDGQPPLPSRRWTPERLRFNLPHTHDQQLPTKIGHIANPANIPVAPAEAVDPDFPGLRAWLVVAPTATKLIVDNQSGLALEDLNVQFRLPLCYQMPETSQVLPSLAIDAQHVFHQRLEKVEGPAKLFLGKSFLVAQIDFRFGNEPARLYATASLDHPADESFPKGRFVKLGPIPPSEFSLERFEQSALPIESPTTEYRLMDGTRLVWKPDSSDGIIQQAYLDDEVIRTQGDWHPLHSPVYALASIVAVTRTTPARLFCRPEDYHAIYLNGERLSTTEQPVELKAGDNHLCLIYQPPRVMGSGRNAGCFFRLVDPATGERLRSIRYRPAFLSKTSSR